MKLLYAHNACHSDSLIWMKISDFGRECSRSWLRQGWVLVVSSKKVVEENVMDGERENERGSSTREQRTQLEGLQRNSLSFIVDVIASFGLCEKL